MSTKSHAIGLEIKSQIIQIDIKIRAEDDNPNGSVTKYVKLLSEKRQLIELQREMTKPSYEQKH